MSRRKDILLGDIHSNGEPAPNVHGTDAHDESFEGSTTLYAKHLIEDHGFTEEDLGDLPDTSDQSSWRALNELHRRARNLPADGAFNPSWLFWMAPRVVVHNNGEKLPEGPDLDQHTLDFKGDHDALARHLINDHGYKLEDVEEFRADGGEAGWAVLRSMHNRARALPDRGPQGHLANDGGPA